MGRVAELEAVPKAVARAGPIDPINLETEKIDLKNQIFIFVWYSKLGLVALDALWP